MQNSGSRATVDWSRQRRSLTLPVVGRQGDLRRKFVALDLPD